VKGAKLTKTSLVCFLSFMEVREKEKQKETTKRKEGLLERCKGKVKG
jgi:hypothetical protein